MRGAEAQRRRGGEEERRRGGEEERRRGGEEERRRGGEEERRRGGEEERRRGGEEERRRRGEEERRKGGEKQRSRGGEEERRGKREDPPDYFSTGPDVVHNEEPDSRRQWNQSPQLVYSSFPTSLLPSTRIYLLLSCYLILIDILSSTHFFSLLVFSYITAMPTTSLAFV